jgi:hypothetical protein
VNAAPTKGDSMAAKYSRELATREYQVFLAALV